MFDSLRIHIFDFAVEVAERVPKPGSTNGFERCARHPIQDIQFNTVSVLLGLFGEDFTELRKRSSIVWTSMIHAHLSSNPYEDRHHIPHLIDGEKRVQQLPLSLMMIACNQGPLIDFEWMRIGHTESGDQAWSKYEFISPRQ